MLMKQLNYFALLLVVLMAMPVFVITVITESFDIIS